VLDRTNLILDIFAQRAETSYARTQVELAQCQYLCPGYRVCGPTSNAKKEESGCAVLGKPR
jgi:GTP-binding protein HflX